MRLFRADPARRALPDNHRKGFSPATNRSGRLEISGLGVERAAGCAHYRTAFSGYALCVIIAAVPPAYRGRAEPVWIGELYESHFGLDLFSRAALEQHCSRHRV